MARHSNNLTTKPRAGRQRLLTGVSLMVLGVFASVTPVNAQMARLRGAVGEPPVVVTDGSSIRTRARPVAMQDALARQKANLSSVDAMRSIVAEARSAALAASRARPTDGLSINGLDPAVIAARSAASDVTGLATWQGAELPAQSVDSQGNHLVSIKQTDPRALLSWNRFDIGAKTTLQFDQKLNGVGQSDWVVVNRVVSADIAPSTILGSIKADGTVLILNRRGVIFGNGAQVNLHSLLVSSLELGNFAKDPSINTPDFGNSFTGLSVKERNTAFLENGLLGPSATATKFTTMLTSSLVGNDIYSINDPNAAFSTQVEGDVVVDRGASLTASNGGFLIITAPKISNDGKLSAAEGQVSLQAGRAISYAVSSGDINGADPDIRGLILRSTTQTGGSVVNSGLIDVPRGYVSLGADLSGNVLNSGLISATTSVARNGAISLTAGTVTLAGGTDTAHAGGLVILADPSAATVPQGTPADPPSFKNSRIDIGAMYVAASLVTNPTGILGPGQVTFGENSLLFAPGAVVSVGGRASQAYDPSTFLDYGYAALTGSILISDGAKIDVSGIKDVSIDASRNSVKISPLKGNELRDTPNYRDVRTDGGFTLNGKTVYVDPRINGVRADGVAWVGSPLIEAGSAISQIGVGAAELMTKGGSVTLGVRLVDGPTGSVNSPAVHLAPSASIDFSGGWVSYSSGWVQTSKLIAADGSLVDISEADPNGIYVGISDGYTEEQNKYGVSSTFANRSLVGGRVEPGYDEGRDAGSLIVRASTAKLAGQFHGDGFAGQRQLDVGKIGSKASSVANDPRKLQSSAYELPSGGLLRVGSFSGKSGVALGGDIILYGEEALDLSDGRGSIFLGDKQLSSAGLSALTLQTSGAVSFKSGSQLLLAKGGQLTVDSGRSITFDGDVTATSGNIRARTYELNGIVLRSLTAATGSPFTTADDVANVYAEGILLPRPFDITVKGTLNVAGLWANDYLDLGALPSGQAWTSGGSISLTSAPKVLVGLGDSLDTASNAADLSGSIILTAGAVLNVSSGGYVMRNGKLDLSAKGGSVSLINETAYAALSRTDAFLDNTSTTDLPIGGENQSVTFTPYFVEDAGKEIRSALAPLVMRSEVRFDASNIKAFSFGGGGTFTLVAPEVTMGTVRPDRGSYVGLDFLQKTGFGTLDISAWRSRLFTDLFNNGITGNSAFLDTTEFVIADGETLNLSQVLLPSILNQKTTSIVTTLATGADLNDYLQAVIPEAAWDQRAATLRLGGLSELAVRSGGKVIGAAGAQIITPKLINSGTIRIIGGSILQKSDLPEVLLKGAIGVKDVEHGGKGLDDVFGPANLVGDLPQYDEKAVSLAADNDASLTNGELFSTSGADRTVYFLGSLDAGTGIRLDQGSVTDLSGGSILNPRAALLKTGKQKITGRLYDGGSIATSAAFFDPQEPLFSDPVYGSARYLIPKGGSTQSYAQGTLGMRFEVRPRARIDLRGAATNFDIQISASNYALTPQWSNGGQLIALAGGTLGGGTILAQGGSVKAQGGTLEWLLPTLRQNYDAATTIVDGVEEIGDPVDIVDNLLSADEIMANGFTTLIARGGLSLDGNISLTLGKAFILSSASAASASPQERDYQVAVTALNNGNTTIRAPYIRLSSLAQTAPDALSTDADTGTLTFSAKTIDLVGALGFATPVGMTEKGAATGSVNFNATGDIRLSGVQPAVKSSDQPPGLTGAIVSTSDIRFKAAQVYATTGTGSLQQLIEDRRAGKSSSAQPYLIASLDINGTVSFASNGGTVPASPYSAGSWVRVLGSKIEQNGVLRAPLGLLELGSNIDQSIPGSLNTAPVTTSLTFGPLSVTSVTGFGLNTPYGVTTDLTEYYFSPNVNTALTAAPVGQLILAGGNIDVKTDAVIDGRGGGDVFAYEFVSGTGGSRDVLSRFNTDSFSSNDGLQFEDGRQVYAILPVSKAGLVASYDPLYSADYQGETGDLYGESAGKTVWLDAAPGITAGEYLLLPAHYALLPGAMRLVENANVAAPFVNAAQTKLDGGIIVGGSYATAGTNYIESTRRAFTVETPDVFLKYSKIQRTSGAANFAKLAEKNGLIAPRSPLDAARFIISPLNSFLVNGTFNVGAVNGRGAQVDIAAANIAVRGSQTSKPVNGILSLGSGDLQKLGANSLLIGGVREDNPDGTTTIKILANKTRVYTGVSLSLPELLLVTAGEGSELRIDGGATISATGVLADRRTGNYLIRYLDTAPDDYIYDNSGIGSFVRVSSGAERILSRQSDPSFDEEMLATGSLMIRTKAALSGNSIAFDTSGSISFGEAPTISAANISLGSAKIAFNDGGIARSIGDQLAAAQNLTLTSRSAITLDDQLPTSFNNLTIDAPGLASNGSASPVLIKAKNLVLTNSGIDLGSCTVSANAGCGDTSALTIKADEIALRDGQFYLYGFDGGVDLAAAKGIYIEGKGALVIDDPENPVDVGLTLSTPLLADRLVRSNFGNPEYSFLTFGDVIIDGSGLSAAASGSPSLGSTISFGSAAAPIASMTIIDAQVRATAGILDIVAKGDISISGTSVLAVPGYSTRIGEASDGLIATAGAGTINFKSIDGSITSESSARIIVDNAIGAAGILNLVAAKGTVKLGAVLNPDIAVGTKRAASLLLDGTSLLNATGQVFDFASFVRDNGNKFQGDIEIHAGSGDFNLDQGQNLRARSVSLTTDDGRIVIAGAIDTSGDDVTSLAMTDPAYAKARVNGGDIALYGSDGVALASTATLRSVSYGYNVGDSRQASAGNIILGIGNESAHISLASGAIVDVSVRQTADRLIGLKVKDPDTLTEATVYRLAAGDLGGMVNFRAPVIGEGRLVDIRNDGQMIGARSLQIEAFKRFDLDAIADEGAFSGVTIDGDGAAHLDAAANDLPNFLADTSSFGSIPEFIRSFNVGLKNGSDSSRYRIRPGVELVSSGSVILDSSINLGAGKITDYAGAVRDGLMVLSPLGPDADGNPRYEVVQGKETELFSRYVDMTFRVGGSVSGDAPRFVIRAGGDLKVNNSISDGFFAFHDRTDPDYISYQLGGGNRSYHPAVNLNCADGGICGFDMPSYSELKDAAEPPSDDMIVTIDLRSSIQGGQFSNIFVHSPFSAAANSVAAIGTNDAIGIGELFPLVNDQPVKSSDIRLVAGGVGRSPNPMQVNRSSRGSVIIAGEKSYSVTATEGDTIVDGPLQLAYDDGSGSLLFGSAGEFLDKTFSDIVPAEFSRDFYTRLDWGSDSDLSEAAKAAAASFFSGNRFIVEDGETVGVYASLGDVEAFLATNFGKGFAANFADIALETNTPISFTQKAAYVRPLVRTGNGSIWVAAGGHIDLSGGGELVYRDVNGASVDELGEPLVPNFDNAQVGGSAIYTAGNRLPAFGKPGSALGGFGAEALNYVPSPQGALDAAPVMAGNGGSISLTAGIDVRGRRDIWSEAFLSSGLEIFTTMPGYESGTTTLNPAHVGAASQRWRVGQIGQNSSIAIVPQLFSSGVGALAGGDVSIKAGRDVNDLTIALDNSVTTDILIDGAKVLLSSASGNLAVHSGRDMLGGQIDLSAGEGRVTVGRDVGAAGETKTLGSYEDNVPSPDFRSLLRLRVSDATISLFARGEVDIGGIGALGAERAEFNVSDTLNAAGFFSPVAGVDIETFGRLELVDNRKELRVAFVDQGTSQLESSFLTGYVLPPSLRLSSLSSDLVFGNSNPRLLYPSQIGQLSLLAGGNMSRFALAMSDANPSDLPGAFSVAKFEGVAGDLYRLGGLGFTFGSVVLPTDDVMLRLYHDRGITHLADSQDALIYAGGSIENVQLSLAKPVRINAGKDIINFYFEGQNTRASDVTSIVAGRDILATTGVPPADGIFAGRPYVGVTNFILGGPGALTVQAGRDLGPFLNSVTVDNVSYAGGIRTIGAEANPWLPSSGADIFALFGVSNGADYTALQDVYLNPAKLDKLDGALFEQFVDKAGNKTPDRSRPIYAPKLARWLRANAPAAFAAAVGDATIATDVELVKLSYDRYDAFYNQFVSAVSVQQQRQFLLNEVYFSELAAPADPNGNSYLQYVRGYRAVQTLFPVSSGYTDNLATFETDPATISKDHPLGVPTKKLVNGQPANAVRKLTGNVDLRLATIQSSRGGDVDLIGPGGDFIAGSVVRTSEQALRKSTPYNDNGIFNIRNGKALEITAVGIDAIPIGYEGVLSLRGGTIRSFTDGDFRLNQSRLFTLSGGDVTMWSSNGDLNAGQGPKSASNFPPITLRFTPNAFAEVDTAGSVAGAGIAAFRPSLDVAPSRVTLLAPVGTVDAGDAGVRASGDVFVAAARVANSDNFKVGGVSVGVPSTAAVAAPAPPANAAAATTATAAQANSQQNGNGSDRPSLIRVDVLGYAAGADNCSSDRRNADGTCAN